MTQIDFHTNIDNPLNYACRLIRKAYSAQKRLVILMEDADLLTLDNLLWTFSALDFIPHCRLENALAQDTPIVMTTNYEEAPHYNILLNLTKNTPHHFARFERLLEVVGNSSELLNAGRDRYRFYRERGYALNLYNQAV